MPGRGQQQLASELFDLKAAQRTQAARVRADAHEVSGASAGGDLAAHGLDFLQLPPGLTVSGYFPYRSEIDVMPLLERLHGEGAGIGLPVVVENGQPLVFRKWAPGDETELDQFKIKIPLASSPEVEPDVLLVPLLAFDERGYRLGYGGGFYDRTLAKLRGRKAITAIGVAYAGQQVDAVVHDANDQPVDWILTENGPMRPHGG